jgi:polysaccharide export outer membrane protein
MKRISLLFLLAALILVTGCQSYKKVPYLQNNNEVDLSFATKLYDAKIMPKDILTITVTCPNNPDAASAFNLTVQSGNTANSINERNTFSSQIQLLPYLVTNEGYIDFPVLGQIKVLGMTKEELENYIAGRVQGTHLKERPIVNVTMSNYKVSVLGEVANAGMYTVSTGKVNILEALAMAGDMTIYGDRSNVKIIRENADGEKIIAELDLKDANIISSPFYQLQQNDIVYVTPNKVKAKNSGIGSETSLWFTSTSILISLASLLYNILR